MDFRQLRSPIGVATMAALTIAATGAGAATIHRFAVSQTTGSGGATTFLQSTTSGSALQGEVATSPRTTIKIPFGVLGEYDATSGSFGIGVAGISTTGYGIGAETFSAASPALISINSATADGSDGIDGYANGTNSAGVYGEGEAAGTPGVEGFSQAYDGVDGFTQTTYEAGVYGDEFQDPSSGTPAFGVYGETDSGIGFGAYATSGQSGGIGLAGESDAGFSQAPALAAYSSASGTDLIDTIVQGNDSNVYQTFGLTYGSANASGTVITTGDADSDINDNGDLYLTGNVYTGCTSIFPAVSTDCTANTTAVARTSTGQARTAFAGHEASPTMEDSGEATLVNGSAHVALDPAYASTISTAQPYLVFMTPMGESKGLYVTNRTPSGFDVRENAGGRSSMTFDYRIVAHPFGDRSTRLAVVGAGSRNARVHHAMLNRTALSFRKHAQFKAGAPHAKRNFHVHTHPRSLVTLTSALR